jgi:hypothetical protein
MDKNIAAILRNDTTTVSVKFDDEPRAKTYTYVTDIPLDDGDHAVVMVGEEFKVVKVVEKHDELRIEPNSDVHYKWIVCKVDRNRFDANIEKNQQIEKTVGRAYQAQLRRSFASAVLASLPDETRGALAGVLGAAA